MEGAVCMDALPDVVQRRVMGYCDVWDRRQMQATSSYYRTMLSSDTRASRVAMAVFAQQPHDSVQRMVALGVLVDTPEYIARFLYHSKGRLSPRGVGMLLTTPSEHAESRRAVLSSFMSHFDFRGLLPSEALRKVLQYTHMPNNSRSIAALLKATAARYVACNGCMDITQLPESAPSSPSEASTPAPTTPTSATPSAAASTPRALLSAPLAAPAPAHASGLTVTAASAETQGASSRMVAASSGAHSSSGVGTPSASLPHGTSEDAGDAAVLLYKDSMYVLLYSLIILHSDLTCHAVTTKMTMRDYCERNAAVPALSGVSQLLCARMYADVAAHGLPVKPIVPHTGIARDTLERRRPRMMPAAAAPIVQAARESLVSISVTASSWLRTRLQSVSRDTSAMLSRFMTE